MKSSLFNVFVPAKQGYAIYNTLNESVLFCDEELKTALEKNDVEKIGQEHISTLQRYGIVVEKEEDELKMYQYRYNTRLCSKREIQLVAVTTYTCNLACPYCYEGKGEIYSCDMDLEMADRIAKVMQSQIVQMQSSYVTLILFGGEPLLNVEVGLYMVRKMREWCALNRRLIRTFMVTNGTLLTDERVSQLKGIDGVQLTFDGSQPYHDETRIYKNGKGTYSEVYSALKRALGAGMKVSLRIQVSKENWRSLEDLFRDINPFLQTGNVRLNIAPLSRYSGMCSNFSSHFLEKEEQDTVLPAMLQYSPDMKPVPNYVPCVAYSNNLIFDGRGDVYRCITSVGEDKRVGRISDEKIVWEPELYTFLERTPLKIERCSTCQYVPLCGGGCPRTAFLAHNTYEKSVCGGSRRVYSEVINQYVKKRFPDKF